MFKKIRLPLGMALAALLAPAANATIVRVQTSLGAFDVNLYDQTTPATVTNFLNYVNTGAYNNSVFHRMVSGFIAQTGGYTYQGTPSLGSVIQNAAVANDPKYSNVRGTIAMAKLSGNANSATNQWFINLGNNSANLDTQNGGFTVFGQVVGNGMTVVDAISALQTFNFGSPFDEIPLRNYTTQNMTNGVTVTDQHLVIVSAITVVDAAANTAASLSPVPNTLINPTSPPPSGGGSSGGGGTMGLWSAALLGLMVLQRRRMHRVAS
jgi:peptidyl-prolyl cis-trans isomerase A (cyclophilin A)